MQGQWDLEWQYSCPAGTSTQLTVNVRDDSGGETGNPALVLQAPGSGVKRFSHGGRLFLQVTSASCNWSLRVVDVPESEGTGSATPGTGGAGLATTGRNVVPFALFGALALALGAWAVNRGRWSKPVSSPWRP